MTTTSTAAPDALPANVAKNGRARLALVVVAAAALLVFAALDDGGVETDAERIQRLADSYACPVCQGESVAESNAAVAVTIRAFIADQVGAGASDDEIRDDLIRGYGASVLLTPPGDGFGALVWILPVVVAAAGAVVVVAIVRRRSASDGDSRRAAAGASGTVVVAAVLVFAAVAGVLLARTLGERGIGDQLTGAIDESPRTKVLRCQELGSTGGDLLGSLTCFDEVLAVDPENAEALAYRGWYLLLAAGSLEQRGAASAPEGTDDGDVASDAAVIDETAAAELTEAGLAYLDRAVEADPTYPDPLAFRATINDRLGNAEAACTDLATLWSLDPPPFFLEQTAAIVERNDCPPAP